MSVTVEEVYDKKRELETSIFNLVHSFEQETKVSVYCIDIIKDRRLHERLQVVAGISVEVKL